MPDSNVLIVSQRQRPDGFGRQPGYVSFTEGEDVLAASIDADVMLIDRSLNRVDIRARRIAGRALRRTMGSDRAVMPGPDRGHAERLSLADHYDAAIFVGFTIWDLPLLERLRAVRRRADRLIVWFPEVWSNEFENKRVVHEPFGLADSIFVGMKAAAPRLAALTSSPVHHVPPAVDVDRFITLRTDDPRPIDVLGIGRRDPLLHRSMLDWSRKCNRLYFYDTISGSQVLDPAAHRENLGDTYRRSKIAITNYAKYDVPAVTGPQRETPGRLWEGLASGAYMIGYPPDERLQAEIIGQPVVDELSRDPSQAIEQIDAIVNSDQSAIARRNIDLALRGHDWIHRWEQIFDASGLATQPGITSRIERLQQMADTLDKN